MSVHFLADAWLALRTPISTRSKQAFRGSPKVMGVSLRVSPRPGMWLNSRRFGVTYRSPFRSDVNFGENLGNPQAAVLSSVKRCGGYRPGVAVADHRSSMSLTMHSIVTQATSRKSSLTAIQQPGVRAPHACRYPVPGAALGRPLSSIGCRILDSRISRPVAAAALVRLGT